MRSGSNNRVGRIANRQRPGRAPAQVQQTSNQSNVQSLRNQANNLRQSIRPNTNQVGSLQSQPGFTVRPSSNDLSSNQTLSSPATVPLARTNSTPDTATVSHNSSPSTNYSGPKVDGSNIWEGVYSEYNNHGGRQGDITSSHVKEIEDQAREEYAFSDHKAEQYENQLESLGPRHKQSAETQAVMDITEGAFEFWQERKEAWREMGNYEVKESDHAFSAFKIEFLRAQMTGLENVMDQWITVNDTGFARSQVAQIRAQVNMVNAAEEFWRHENDFWRKEHESEYKAEDKEAVLEIYKNIEGLQKRYEAILLDESDESGIKIFEELEKSKKELREYQLNPSPRDEYASAIPYAGGTINVAKEKAFSSFKQEFYRDQITQSNGRLEELEHVPGSSQKQAHIRKDRELNNSLLDFWKEQEVFWQRISNTGHSKENREEIDYKLAQVTGLENQLDQWMGVYDDTGFAKTQVAELQMQLDTVKAEIRFLHTEF